MRAAMRKDARGAVLTEFVVALMPFLMLFFVCAQYSIIAVAKILTQHAAFMGARAAMVVCPDPQSTENPQGTIQQAVKIAYGPLGDAAKPVANVSNESCNITSQDLVTVDVRTDFPCTVPLGGRLFCGGATKTLRASASMPNQGSYITKIMRDKGEEGAGKKGGEGK